MRFLHKEPGQKQSREFLAISEVHRKGSKYFMQMDPSSQQAPPIKHMMTVPEKIELTSTGAYPSPPRAGTAGQRQDGAGYRMMRVPDRIMLETGVGGEGESETGGVVGGYVHQSQ